MSTPQGREWYRTMLARPEWQRKRLEVMQAADFACECCGDREKPQAVHHRYYETGKKPWEYPTAALQCLCDDCHKEIEESIEDIRQQLIEAGLPVGDLRRRLAECCLYRLLYIREWLWTRLYPERMPV